MKEYFTEGKFLHDIRFWSVILILIFLGCWYKACHQDSIIDSHPDLSYKIPEITYKDEKGVSHSQTVATPTTEKIISRLVDSLLSDNRKLRNANSLLQATTSIDTVFITKIKWVDTIKGDFNIAKSDNYIDLDVNGNVKTNESSISLKTKDTLSIVTTTKKHLFKPDETLFDISLKSPYQKVQQVRSFTIPEKKSIITLGVGAGMSYNGETIRPTLGVYMVYNLLSLKTRK